MRYITVGIALICIVGVWVVEVCAEKNQWEFSGVTTIKIDGVSGDVVIRAADGKKGRVELKADVHPPENFRAEVEQDGKKLYIDEDFRGGNTSGPVEWTIYLPKGREIPTIRISNASGDFDCKGVACEIDLNTASGDIELLDVKLARGSKLNTASGDFTIEKMTVREDTKFSTASGDIELVDVTIEEDCRFSTASGNIECRQSRCMDDVGLSSASGDVVVKDTELLGEGEFSSASGDVSVYFSRLPKTDFTASSASGDVLLDVENFGDDFTLIMVKREDRGRISCPFEYTDEDTFEDHHVYEEKIVKRGSGRPVIELRTASGKVVVKD
ncbi:MAG: DUF4097 family beta strand repeat protein [Candidatus Latescibacterota bacterium]|nr:MAG: DUF4097 family beta strand repeat protein [Candidatus Latescibacterota bacterium]